MSQASKLLLSDEERALASDARWINCKTSLTRKIVDFFASLARDWEPLIQESRQRGVSLPSASPRVYKGENYLGLPYVNMDYPATFSKEGILAVRTLFWWGNCFSITLHVSGQHLAQLDLSRVREAANGAYDWYFCHNEAEWAHHFEADNYKRLSLLSDQEWVEQVRQRSFIKLARRFPLNEMDTLPETLTGAFSEMLSWLVSCPAGETGLSPDAPKAGSGL